MKRLLLVIVAGVLIVLSGVAPSQAQDESAANCVTVGGTFIINFVDQTTGIAVLTGDLRGAVRGTIVENVPGDNGVLNLTLQHVIVTEAGDLILTSDIATLTPIVDGVFYMQQTQTIVSATGHYQNATGTLNEFGVVNMATGEGVLRYRGEICFGQ